MDRKQIIESIMADFVTFKRKIMIESHQHTDHGTITPAQGQALFVVHQHKQITTSDLAKILGVTVSAATQLCDCLTEAGCLVKEASTDDRRSFILKLSEKTGKNISKMKKDSISHFSHLFDTLSETELEQYHKLSHKIISSFKQ